MCNFWLLLREMEHMAITRYRLAGSLSSLWLCAYHRYRHSLVK